MRASGSGRLHVADDLTGRLDTLAMLIDRSSGDVPMLTITRPEEVERMRLSVPDRDRRGGLS